MIPVDDGNPKAAPRLHGVTSGVARVGRLGLSEGEANSRSERDAAKQRNAETVRDLAVDTSETANLSACYSKFPQLCSHS